MENIYIDVTESYAWQGKVTGIIRVIDELCNRFYAEKATPHFVVWNEGMRSFTSIDYQKIIDRQNNDSINPITITDEVYAPKIKLPLSRTVKKFQNKVIKAQSEKNNFIPTLIEPSSILFMPHGGVWGSEAYESKVMQLQTDSQVVLVPILYDMCPIVSPQYCSEGIRRIFASHMQIMLPNADLVLSISENTAKDARAWIQQLTSQKIQTQVFRLGDEIGHGDMIKPALLLPEKYILCVGTIEARKNHTSLYYAYKIATENGVELPSLIVAGRKGWLAEDIYEVMTVDPDTKDKIVFLHGTTDEELSWLYAHAQFSVYPSFYEGWGLPVAESLLRGVPCLASSSSSIPEIAGNLIDYFSPYDPHELLEALKKYSFSDKYLEKKRAAIQQEYKTTTWDQAYIQVKSALNSLR